VARATSAAPTYFEAVEAGDRALIDGGVFATNPAMCGLAEALNRDDVSPRDVVLLSLGTGEHTHRRSFDEIKDWGVVEWARPILDVRTRWTTSSSACSAPSATGASRWS
jgi:patatin-like phospholipase/acyl hydrolase